MYFIMKERDTYIDFLRTIGLLLLIVAHTSPPKWVFILRSFDVPLMVFISGICWHLPPRSSHISRSKHHSLGDDCGDYTKGGMGGYIAINQFIIYCKKRIIRIYKPVFIFLSLYFCLELLFHILINTDITSFPNIIGSFMLLNSPSIGYVWIMRVFILMAILSPLYYRIASSTSSTRFILIVCILLITQQLMIYGINRWSDNWIRYILNLIIPYAFGYGIINSIGMKAKHFTRKNLFLLSFGVLLTAIFSMIISKSCYLALPINKYPPNILFLCYGIIMCSILWLSRPLLQQFSNYRWIQFVSKNSIWIYLWHIIGVNMLYYCPLISRYWLCRYLFVLTTAICLTILYKYILSKFNNSKNMQKI